MTPLKRWLAYVLTPPLTKYLIRSRSMGRVHDRNHWLWRFLRWLDLEPNRIDRDR